MAEKRMLSKVISISEKVNSLPDLFDMLLYTWMIPHADDFGRLTGSPAKIKALIVPMLDKTIADINGSLARLHENGLIVWYEADDEKVIQIDNFDKHQQGLHKRTKSKFPDFPGSSGNFPKIPPELNRTEQNRREENRREEEQIFGGGSGFNPYRFYEQEGFGTISPVTKDQIDDLVQMYGDRWYQEAIRVAVMAGKRSLSYVNGILKRWQADGIEEPWKGEKSSEEHKGRYEGVQSRGHSKQSEFAFLDQQNRTGTN